MANRDKLTSQIARRALGLAGCLQILSVAALQESEGTPAREWPTYGGDLANTRYWPLDQINKDNFSELEVA